MLTGLMLAGGSAYLGLKAYTQRSKKTAAFLRPASPRVATPPLSLVRAKRLVQEATRAFASIERRQHQEVLTTSGKAPSSKMEQQINRRLLLSAAIMGNTAVAMPLYPAMSLVGVAGVLYMSFPFFCNAYRELRKGRVTTRPSKNAVFGQQPQQVWVECDGIEVQLPIEQVKVGDQVVVNAGEIIPVDGSITSGTAAVDQRLLTGEAQPVEKEPGDPAYAATVVLTGRIWIAVEHAGSETKAAQIDHILHHTQGVSI